MCGTLAYDVAEDMLKKQAFSLLVPSEPLSFVVNIESNTSVQLSWSAPLYSNGIITKYHVYYKKTTENIVGGSRTTNGTQYFLERLAPYTNYSFWVYAETSAGLGNKSVTIFNKTYEGGN